MGWLKFEDNTPDKPEVFAITAAMGWDDPDLTVGKLMRVWRWFDQQTIDGNAPNVTLALLDRISGVSGFSKAMCDVGWLVADLAGLHLPHFDRHNGKTAKDRALTAKRVANFKASKDENDEGNGASVTSALPREEKKRKDKELKPKTTPSPVGDLLAGIDSQVASDFKALRTKLKAPITKTAMNGITREAGKAGISLEAALTMCCERGWRGFKADWVAGNQSGSPPGGRPEKFNPTAYANRNRSTP